jgi:hypothetical protein
LPGQVRRNRCRTDNHEIQRAAPKGTALRLAGWKRVKNPIVETSGSALGCRWCG